MMTPANPTEIQLSFPETAQRLDELVDDIDQGAARVVIEADGRAMAAIIAIRDYERFMQMEQERTERFAALSRISAALTDIPVDELEADDSRMIADTRARRSE